MRWPLIKHIIRLKSELHGRRCESPMTLNYYSISHSLSRQTDRLVTVIFYWLEHRSPQKRFNRRKRDHGSWEPLPRARVPEFRGYSDDYVCGNHCRVTRDAHAKAKNRRNQSSSTSALYLGFVSASLLLVGTLFPLLSSFLSHTLLSVDVQPTTAIPG